MQINYLKKCWQFKDEGIFYKQFDVEYKLLGRCSNTGVINAYIDILRAPYLVINITCILCDTMRTTPVLFLLCSGKLLFALYFWSSMVICGNIKSSDRLSKLLYWIIVSHPNTLLCNYMFYSQLIFVSKRDPGISFSITVLNKLNGIYPRFESLQHNSWYRCLCWRSVWFFLISQCPVPDSWTNNWPLGIIFPREDQLSTNIMIPLKV